MSGIKQRWGRWAALPALIGVTFLGGTGAHAQTVYASTILTQTVNNVTTTTNRFGTFDLTTGAFQQIGGPLVNPLYGLGFYAPNNGIYGIDGDNALYYVDRNTGVASQQFQFNLDPVQQELQSIAFDSATNILYGIAANATTGANANLYRLSTTSNVATLIGSGLGFNTFGGLAIVNTNGVSTGYATQGTANSAGPVFQINLSNGTATALGATAGVANPISAIASVNGLLKAVDYRGSTINQTYDINRLTGVATPQGTYNRTTVGNVYAITSITPNAAPEPGTLGLLVSGLSVGLGGIAVVRRRKKS